jgi:hypothetical protein
MEPTDTDKGLRRVLDIDAYGDRSFAHHDASPALQEDAFTEWTENYVRMCGAAWPVLTKARVFVPKDTLFASKGFCGYALSVMQLSSDEIDGIRPHVFPVWRPDQLDVDAFAYTSHHPYA